MTVNKDQYMQEWAAQNPILTDALLFNFLSETPGSCAIIPMSSDAAVKTYINGTAERVYDYALQVILETSDATDTTNTDNMYLQRQWQDWILQQETDGNYPNFGPNCSGYRWELLSNGPQLAAQYENNTAKFQFFARLNYREAPQWQ